MKAVGETGTGVMEDITMVIIEGQVPRIIIVGCNIMISIDSTCQLDNSISNHSSQIPSNSINKDMVDIYKLIMLMIHGNSSDSSNRRRKYGMAGGGSFDWNGYAMAAIGSMVSVGVF
jgi:hypothetical protein